MNIAFEEIMVCPIHQDMFCNMPGQHFLAILTRILRGYPIALRVSLTSHFIQMFRYIDATAPKQERKLKQNKDWFTAGNSFSKNFRRLELIRSFTESSRGASCSMLRSSQILSNWEHSTIGSRSPLNMATHCLPFWAASYFYL